jgi:hypothetical protein
LTDISHFIETSTLAVVSHPRRANGNSFEFVVAKVAPGHSTKLPTVASRKWNRIVALETALAASPSAKQYGERLSR